MPNRLVWPLTLVAKRDLDENPRVTHAVQIPASLQSDDYEVSNLDVIETICYGTILDDPLVEQFEESQSPDEVSSVFTYFGSWTGVMRIFPGANYGTECGDYDPRIRPW